MTSVTYFRTRLKSASQAYPFPLHFTWQIGRMNIIGELTEKRTIHWTITPPPTLSQQRTGCLNITTVDYV